MNARRLLACASSVGALLTLTACEKPAPLVTVVSGGESVYTEASTWCFEGQEPPDCAERAEDVTELAVRAGETVGVDVGKQLLDRRWYLELAAPEGATQEGQQPTQPQRSEPQDEHYFTFTAPNLPEDGALLTVRALGEGDEPTGEWRFRLTPKG